MVGPKNMTEAVKTIETLDSEKKDLEVKKEGLKKKKTELEARVRRLNLEKEGLDTDNQMLTLRVQQLEGEVQNLRAVLIERLRQRNNALLE